MSEQKLTLSEREQDLLDTFLREPQLDDVSTLSIAELHECYERHLGTRAKIREEIVERTITAYFSEEGLLAVDVIFLDCFGMVSFLAIVDETVSNMIFKNGLPQEFSWFWRVLEEEELYRGLCHQTKDYFRVLANKVQCSERSTRDGL